MNAPTQEKAIEKPQKSYIATLGDLLRARKESLASALPKHLSVDRLIMVALNCVQKVPKLQKAAIDSVLQAVRTCAELGLEPGGALGGAYLVPYESKKTGIVTCQLVIGYRGFVDLMRRSGYLESVKALAVHEKDRFRYAEGLETVLIHEPYLDGPAGKLRFVYCVLRLRDGGTQVTVMSLGEVEAIRARSRSASDGPWVTDFEQMALKTVIRRAAKLAPMSADMARAIEAEDDGDVVDGEVVLQSTTIDAPTESTAAKALRKKLKVEDKSTPEPKPSPSKVTSTGEPPADVPLPTAGQSPEPPPLSDADIPF